MLFFPLRYRLLLWTPLAPVWWPVATTMTCGSGTLPAWTRPCRPSDRSSRATGESTSEKTTTRSCLTCASSVPCKCWRCVCVCQSPHKHICRAWWSLTLTHGHPLVSFKMSPFRCRWLSYVTVYVSKLVYSKALIKDQILFLRICGQSRSCLRLLTQVYATLDVIMARSSSLFGLQTSRS